MAATKAEVLDALAPILTALHADGAELEVDAVSDEAVDLRLVLTSARCAECVLPRPMLEGMMLDALGSRFPAIDTVRLVDPRESGDLAFD